MFETYFFEKGQLIITFFVVQVLANCTLQALSVPHLVFIELVMLLSQ